RLAEPPSGPSRPSQKPATPMVRALPVHQAGACPKSTLRRVSMNPNTVATSAASAMITSEPVASSGVTAPAVVLRDVRKVFGQADAAVVALDGISIGLSRGSFTAIMGPSGSGKSTFLHIAAGLERPTSGAVALGDTELQKLGERRLTIL